ncbi:MAG: hypothetical protein RBT50_05700 [Bacteroidales bacterium]|jgi:hypothetical protein|nr:hypothetical protein [Bacteroidales bacterium]
MKETRSFFLPPGKSLIRHFLLSLLPLLVSATALSQQRPWPTADDAARFLKSVTCVVKEADPFSFYNAEIRDAVDKYWKVTPVKYITVEEFNVMRNDPSYSFLVLTITNFSNDKSGSTYDFLNLLQGADVDELDQHPEFCAIPLCFSGAPEEEYSYKLGLIIRFMEYHAELVMKNPSTTALRYLKYYNKNVPEIRNKTILVREDDLAPEVNTLERIAVHYPYKVRIVDEEEIIRAIEEKEKDVLIVHKVGPDGVKQTGTCMKTLIGTDDAVMYYYDSHMVDSKNASGLLISDLKRLARF